MVYRRLGLRELIDIVCERVKNDTATECYDAVPENSPDAFYCAEAAKVEPADTDTMLADVFTLKIHAVESEAKEKDVYSMIEALQKALGYEIELSDELNLMHQKDCGTESFATYGNGRAHAVTVYEFKVIYGTKCKN